ncbi:DUF1835 domain-containing protein [Fulvivirgaceae bacterium BMA10]|uniref:DUF1835 domain-containing protein n=1 Tax=Splendidivirga corallicola TaxID=3051826 RepID=A0ABT8KHM3_9BACT|nr:DUF1835 domain-containing protein [Fulvivirgaceae bacterium BMA10]
MDSTLHILNGDGTYYAFKESGIQGDVMIWREALACGPVDKEVASETFWKTRSEFITKSYDGLMSDGPTIDDYIRKTKQEFEKLQNIDQYQEVILWFEFDLFCQINMIAMLSWLWQNHRDHSNLSLICIDQHPNHPDFRGLGQLTPEELAGLLPKKIALERADLKFAHNVWNAYAGSEPNKMLEVLSEQHHEKFPYLKKAIEMHLKRFPSIKTGLNVQQTNLLGIIKMGVESKHRLIGEALKQDKFYGFGDTQYFIESSRLSPLINEGDTLSLNDLGESVLSGKQDFLSVSRHIEHIGGAKNIDYRWDEVSNTLKNN